MIVYGYKVPEKVIKVCEKHMIDGFEAQEIEAIAYYMIKALKNDKWYWKQTFYSQGEIAMRIADRLIQKNRKAGLIRFDTSARQWIQL